MMYSEGCIGYERVAVSHGCPFCGHLDSVEIGTKAVYDELFSGVSGAIRMRCGNCSLDLWEYGHNGEQYDDLRKLLIEKWENRPGKIEEED